MDGRQLAEDFLGASAHHGHMVQPQQLHNLLEEIGTAQQRLEKSDLQVGTHQCQRDAGQTGAGADIADGDPLRHDLGEHGAVQQVPLPQPRHLTRTDQTALDARVREEPPRTGLPPGRTRRKPSALLEAHGEALLPPSREPSFRTALPHWVLTTSDQ